MMWPNRVRKRFFDVVVSSIVDCFYSFLDDPVDRLTDMDRFKRPHLFYSDA
jgi:hypothetical protein